MQNPIPVDTSHNINIITNPSIVTIPDPLPIPIPLPSHSTVITSSKSNKLGVITSKMSIGKKKRLFTRDLKVMMYGFGDVYNPLPESIDLMEDLVHEYIHEMTIKAMAVASKRGKLATEDLIFLVRKDKKKYARVKELLSMYEELKRARKAFDMPDGQKHIQTDV